MWGWEEAVRGGERAGPGEEEFKTSCLLPFHSFTTALRSCFKTPDYILREDPRDKHHGARWVCVFTPFAFLPLLAAVQPLLALAFWALAVSMRPRALDGVAAGLEL